ncbi:MAG TPA: flagellar hook-associated protein FlgL [Burkholderiaceae bacterium]|nr:flagellar hook-associated protein FlgL [Burkholderiaceae bacterium]
MRISSSLFFQTGLNSINAQQSDLMHLFQQIGSGQRMVTPADDPLAAAQAINISQAQSLNTQYAANRGVAKTSLGTEENALNSVTTLMQDVKSRLVQAGNGTLSDDDRATLANVLSNAKASLLALANSTDGNGQYLFSGMQGTSAPYAQDPTGKVTWQGDAGQRNIQVDQTRQLPSGDVGVDVFQRATPGTNTYLTAAATTNTGTGIISSPQVTDPHGANVGSSFSIAFTSPTAYTVTVTAPDGATSTYAGAYSPGNTSIALNGGVQVNFSGQPATGDTFTVQPAASSGVDLNIFDSFDSIISALKAPVNGDPAAQAKLSNTLASVLQRTGVNYNNILTVRSSIGARLNEIDAIDANGSQRGLSYSSQLSSLEDLDYYSASANLQLRQSALQAATDAFRKIQSTNLFSSGTN